jgi:hypothetical protein
LWLVNPLIDCAYTVLASQIAKQAQPTFKEAERREHVMNFSLAQGSGK